MRYFFIFLSFFCFLAYPQIAGDLLKDSKKEQARLYRNEGYRLQMQGDLFGALSFYKKAIELDPAYVEAFNDIGVIYELIGDLDSAILFYKKALEIDSKYLQHIRIWLFYMKKKVIY